MPVTAIRGCEIHYDVSGAPTGIPMVWGHGLTSSRAAEDEFPLVDTALIRVDRGVLRYDARGHGDSGDLGEVSNGSWDQLAHDQTALIDALGIGRVVVGGASMGAATALHAAAFLGDRLAALVLAIPPTAWDTRTAQAEVYDSMADIVEARGVEPLIAASASVAPPDPFVPSTRVYKDRRAATLRAADPRRLAAAFRGARGTDLPAEESVGSIEVPTLILAWSGDPGHPVSSAERLDDLMPNTELAIASTMEELSTWTERVRRFLRTVDSPTGSVDG